MKKNLMKWTWMLGAAIGMASCGLDMPKETNQSFAKTT